MADFDKTIQEMRDMQDYVSGRLVDVKNFKAFVVSFTGVWKKLVDQIKTSLKDTENRVSEKIKTLDENVKKDIADVKVSINDVKKETKDSIENTKSFLQDQISTNYELLKSRIDIPVDFSEVEQKLDDLRGQIPTQFDAKDIEERIDELEDKLKELANKKVTTNTVIQGGGIVGRDIIKDIDLSAQLDGVTKTFNIQAIWNVVSVNLSSYPYGALRKGIDYTWTPTSITFTDEIDASTQLGEGQKCILTVVQS
jgi:hypothetical protein